MKDRFLLHACCATCAVEVISRLSKEFRLSLFIFNPNIHPKEEYEKRMNDIKSYAQKIGITCYQGDYRPEQWLRLVRGLEGEPEGGKRCELCYQIRLEESAWLAKEKQIPVFGTTLTISPHKKAAIINKIGSEAGKRHGVDFFQTDFKKQDGFKRASQKSRQSGFYRQNYCGCVYSSPKAKI